MYRVLFVHWGLESLKGGAEHSLQHHIRHAPRSVEVCAIAPDQECDIDAYDAVVLGNLRPFGGNGAESEVMWILRWATLLQSYRGFSLRSERDVHPCTFRDGRCLVGDLLERKPCCCTHTQRDCCELLYNACSAVQLLSPAHQTAINQLIDIKSRQYLIGSPIDLELFQNVVPRAERPAKALIIGDDLRVAETADQRAIDAGYQPERIEYLSVPFPEMPALYNRYQAVVVDPVVLHAYGRVAVEALACGCRVLASKRVGALSWPDPIQASREANQKFWELVCWGCRIKRLPLVGRIAA